MRILIISQYYYPEQFLLNDIAPALVRRGNQVTVVTGRPNYPGGDVFAGYEGTDRAEETINGVFVKRLPIIPRGHSMGHLLLNYLSYMFRANRAVKQFDGQYDVVFLYQLTPILQAYPAVKYARRNHVRLICYCLDLAPLSGNKVAAFIKPLHRIYRRFSQWAYQNCDHIAVTSKDFIGYLRTMHKVPNGRLSYIPQHAAENLLHVDLRKMVLDDAPPVFMFAGNLGIGARLDHIVYAAERLKHSELRFLMFFIGNGSAKKMLEELVRRLHLEDCIIFHDRVPMAEMEHFYRKADALIVTLRRGQITVPGKVQAYMATGKPILGAMDGSGKKLIEEAKCGLCVDAEDVDGLIRIMSLFISHPEQFLECGERGRRYFRENFLLETFMDKLTYVIEGKN